MKFSVEIDLYDLFDCSSDVDEEFLGDALKMKYIGERFENYLSQKRFDENGRVPNWDSGKKYSATDFLVRGYFSEKLDEKISEMIKKAQEESEQTVFDLVETRLKENLAANTISRMNIPGILKQMQEQANNIIEMTDKK